MKKIFLVVFCLMCIFSCSKKVSDKMAPPPPTPQPQIEPAKPPLEAKTVEDKLSIPEGISPDLLASLHRTPCFGSCPAYKVEIFKDGTVKYKGMGYVKRIGFFSAKADSDFMAELQKQAQTINYMKLGNKYPAENVEMTDLPKTISYIRVGNDGKQIINNFDAPKELVAFERWFEKHIETLKWQEAKD
jgi:hypothetical protein